MLPNHLFNTASFNLVLAKLWHFPLAKVKLRQLIQKIHRIAFPTSKCTLIFIEYRTFILKNINWSSLFDNEFLCANLWHEQSIVWTPRTMQNFQFTRWFDEIDANLQIHRYFLLLSKVLRYYMEEALAVLAMLVNKLFDIVNEFFNVLLFDSW